MGKKKRQKQIEKRIDDLEVKISNIDIAVVELAGMVKDVLKYLNEQLDLKNKTPPKEKPPQKKEKKLDVDVMFN